LWPGGTGWARLGQRRAASRHGQARGDPLLAAVGVLADPGDQHTRPRTALAQERRRLPRRPPLDEAGDTGRNVEAHRSQIRPAPTNRDLSAQSPAALPRRSPRASQLETNASAAAAGSDALAAMRMVRPATIARPRSRPPAAKQAAALPAPSPRILPAWRITPRNRVKAGLCHTSKRGGDESAADGSGRPWRTPTEVVPRPRPRARYRRPYPLTASARSLTNETFTGPVARPVTPTPATSGTPPQPSVRGLWRGLRAGALGISATLRP
jgi:hypothetical protein